MISLRDSPIYRQKSFDESKHPRGEGGKFGEGGGGAGKPESKLPASSKEHGKIVQDARDEIEFGLSDISDFELSSEEEDAIEELESQLSGIGADADLDREELDNYVRMVREKLPIFQNAGNHKVAAILRRGAAGALRASREIGSSKSVVYRRKSKDASGHVHSAAVSGKPANNLPK